MSAEDQYLGSGHQEEPYVDFIRGISREVHDETVRREKAKSYDEGWLNGIDHALRQMREENRIQRRRHIARAEGALRRWKRDTVLEVLSCLGVLLVAAIATYLMRGAA